MRATAAHGPSEAAARPAAAREALSAGPTPAAELVLGLQAAAGNRAVRRLLRQVPAVAAPPGAMTRQEFEQTMARRFNVRRFHDGTQADMAARLRRGAGAAVVLPGWTDWNPGPASTIYSAIVDAFEDVDRAFGGTPVVNQISFFDADYAFDAQRNAFVRQPDVGASYGAGLLTVYRAVESRDKPLPVARSTARGNYPRVVIAVTGIEGQSPGAPLPYSDRQESQRRIIAHELGHGLAEAALGPTPDVAPDPTMMADFRREVGWTAAEPAELFDAGDPAVRQALASGARPAAQPITPQNWNAPSWSEQPVSHYAVAGGPAEDFAESVMTFVRAPDLLRSRSPRRYAFLSQRQSRWRRALQHVEPPGDYPLPQSDTRLA